MYCYRFIRITTEDPASVTQSLEFWQERTGSRNAVWKRRTDRKCGYYHGCYEYVFTGVDPGLDFSNMSEISETYERLTRMQVSPRQPYAGELVFTAFSGSHQDAIAKGMAWREEKQCQTWTVPYLPLDQKMWDAATRPM